MSRFPTITAEAASPWLFGLHLVTKDRFQLRDSSQSRNIQIKAAALKAAETLGILPAVEDSILQWVPARELLSHRIPALADRIVFEEPTPTAVVSDKMASIEAATAESLPIVSRALSIDPPVHGTDLDAAGLEEDGPDLEP